MALKKTKKGQNLTEGFDATPPGDVDMSPGNGNGKRNRIEPENFSEKGKKGLKKWLSAYKTFLVDSFRRAPRAQQESWIDRFSQICCVGISVVILQAFYSVLLAPFRIISLPLVVGGAWFIANKLVAPAIITRLGDYMNRD